MAAVALSVGAWAAVATTAGGAVAAFVASERLSSSGSSTAVPPASFAASLTAARHQTDGHCPGPELVSECEEVISVQNQAWMAKRGEESPATADRSLPTKLTCHTSLQ